jgi:plasmid stabilization system protein ParE
MSFRVLISDAAAEDIRLIVCWIKERSESGAETWYRRWLEVLSTLQGRADSYPTAPENEDHSETIRQILFKTKYGRMYRALFTINAKDVNILHVRGPGQKFVDRDEINRS